MNKLQKAREIFSEIDSTCILDQDAPNRRDGSLIQMNIIPIRAGEEIELKQSKIRNGVRFFLKPFHVCHGGHPALGYTIVSKTTKTRLKAEFKKLDGKELGSLARSGININESVIVENVEVCYTGDTSVDGLVRRQAAGQDPSEVRSSENLRQGFTAPLILCELTFLDAKDQQLAKQRGHLNVKDIEEILRSHGWASHQSDSGGHDCCIMFYHVSSRHGPAKRLLDAIIEGLPNDIVRVADLAVASFIAPDEDLRSQLKPNGCISLKHYGIERPKR